MNDTKVLSKNNPVLHGHNVPAGHRTTNKICVLALERPEQRLQKEKAALSEKFGDPTETAANTIVSTEADTTSQCTAANQSVQVPGVSL